MNFFDSFLLFLFSNFIAFVIVFLGVWREEVIKLKCNFCFVMERGLVISLWLKDRYISILIYDFFVLFLT